MALRADLIAKSIEVEELARDFYLRLKELLPEDAELWDGLIDAETEHVKVIEGCAELIRQDKTVEELLFPCIHMLRHTCDSIGSAIAGLEPGGITRERAFEQAIRIEKSVGENYLQASIRYAKSPALHELFRSIGMGDESHADMILHYMRRKGFSPEG